MKKMKKPRRHHGKPKRHGKYKKRRVLVLVKPSIHKGRKNMDNKEIEALAEQIRHHNTKYWVDNSPEIADEEYDKLVKKLESVAPFHVVLTEIVADTGGSKGKFQHLVPMLSLDKLFKPEEIAAWAEGHGGLGAKCRDTSRIGIVASYKVDGLSCAIHYENGKIVRAVTRGDGTEGDDVTANVLVISGVPKTVASKRKFEVRGEVYMTNASFRDNVEKFEKLLADGKAKESERPKNARNFCAGSLKQKDPNTTRERGLSFMAHGCLVHDGESRFKTEWELLGALEKLNFETPKNEIIKDVSRVPSLIESVGLCRKSFPYDMDGIVFALNDISLHAELGETGHHPRYKIAFKFAREQGETDIVDIHWNTSRTGRVVPQLQVKPIPLGGASVTYATGHNAKGVKDMNIGPGSRILMEREVIPYVVKKIGDAGAATMPSKCSSCGSKLEWEPAEDGKDPVDLICPNIAGCEAQLQDYFKHYISRKVCNMTGVGESLIEKLLAVKMVKTPADLFRLTEEQIMNGIERQGESSAKKIVSSIQERREQKLSTFLYSLGIPSLGDTISEKLADRFKTLDAVLSADVETLRMDKIGEKLAPSIYAGLKSRSGLISDLLKEVKIIDVKKVDGPLSGKSFCLTGKVVFEFGGKQFDSRPDIEDLIKSKGGEIKSVSKNLNYLVAGEGAGDKLEKAAKAKVAVLDAKQLVKMLG